MRILFTFLLLALSQQGMTVDCNLDEVEFTEDVLVADALYLFFQEQVDEFPLECTSVDRAILIGNSLSWLCGECAEFGAPVTSLSRLGNLQSIDGGLTILNSGLNNLDGLADLTSINGQLIISGNEALINLDGLSNLESAGDELQIGSNTALTDLSGLGGVSDFTWISISGNASLLNTDLNLTLSDLQMIAIYNNENLVDCGNLATAFGWPNKHPHAVIERYHYVGDNADGCNDILEIYKSVAGTDDIDTTYKIPVNCGSDDFQSYNFTSQTEIDSFQETFGPCNRLTGLMSVTGEDITNIDGLSGIIDTVGYSGGIKISNTGIDNVDGLSDLVYASELSLSGNSNLNSIEGLGALVKVGGWWSDGTSSGGGYSNSPRDALVVRGNGSFLSNLGAIKSLVYVDYIVTDINIGVENLRACRIDIINSNIVREIDGNFALDCVSGTFSTSEVNIRNNSILSDLSELSISADSVGLFYFSIQDNPILNSLGGLTLDMSGNTDLSLSISNNDRLTSLSNFSLSLAQEDPCSFVFTGNGLANCRHSLSIARNDALTDLPDFGSLKSLKTLAIGGDSLTDLSSLTDLERIETLSISTAIQSLSTLSQLREAQHVVIDGTQLIDLDGLENLQNLCSISLRNNEFLMDIEALAGVNSCYTPSIRGWTHKTIEITGNSLLKNIDVLNPLLRGEPPLCDGCPYPLSVLLSGESLESLEIFKNVRRLPDITLRGLGVDSLMGLEDIRYLNRLAIWDNNELTDISALKRLRSVSDYVRIYNNQQLDDCGELALLLGWPDGADSSVMGSTRIENNATSSFQGASNPCNSVDQVLSFAPFRAYELQNKPGTVCKATDPAKSIKLQSTEGGLINTETEENISVACPLPRNSSTSREFLNLDNVAFSVTVNARKTTGEYCDLNEDGSCKKASCILYEYVDGELRESESKGIELIENKLGSGSWKNWRPDEPLTNYVVMCDLPPGAMITSLNTREVY